MDAWLLEDGFPALTPEEVAALPHDDLGPTMVGSTWALVSVALVFISLRVYCKITRHKALWWDDNFLIASWVRPPLPREKTPPQTRLPNQTCRSSSQPRPAP